MRLNAHLRHHVRNGRFGYFAGGAAAGADAPLRWTIGLLVNLGSDLRDAYDGQLIADAIANGDTVMVADYPVLGTCCAFVVVLVQRRGRGTPGDHLRVYLDRARPSYGAACPDPTVSGVTVPCCANAIPTTLFATFQGVFGGCVCCNGFSVTLTWTPGMSVPLVGTVDGWTGSGTWPCNGASVTVYVWCDTGSDTWTGRLLFADGFETAAIGFSSVTCNPLQLVSGFISLFSSGGTEGCGAPGLVTMTVTQ
jgi:hypothetical protein